jgi:2-(1,2-epoxy-1,2-dihydrophenyl)acetyl-CoA isomerase
MALTSIQLERRGAVAVVTFDRPESANSVDLAFTSDLVAVADSCHADPAIGAVLVTGAGRNFCFGGDLRAMAARGEVRGQYLTELTQQLHAGILAFTNLSVPVIVAANGTTAGAGVGLMAMADLAYCGASSRLRLAYTGVGLTPDAGASFWLPRTVGYKRAMELLLLNRTLSAAEMLEWGLVNGVFEDASLVGQSFAIAQQLASGPTRAFGKTKQLVAHALRELEAQLAREGQTIASQGASAEGQEGISAFLEKRQPKYSRSDPHE